MFIIFRSRHRRFSVKKVFLKSSQISKKNTRVRTPTLKNICQQMNLYFHYKTHHQYHCHHFNYHQKMHFYRLIMLLTIPLICHMIPCLFQLNFVFFLPEYILSSLIPSYWFFMHSKQFQNSFATTRQILPVLLLLIFIFIVIYTSLFTLTCLHLLTLT